MQECHYCKEKIRDGEAFCQYCGYDPATDTIRQNFTPSEKLVKHHWQKEAHAGGGVSPGVKNFAFIGLAILLFSIFYKYNFSISNIAAEAKHFFTMISKGKFNTEKSKSSKEIEWIDVRTFKEDAEGLNERF